MQIPFLRKLDEMSFDFLQYSKIVEFELYIFISIMHSITSQCSYAIPWRHARSNPYSDWQHRPRHVNWTITRTFSVQEQSVIKSNPETASNISGWAWWNPPPGASQLSQYFRRPTVRVLCGSNIPQRAKDIGVRTWLCPWLAALLFTYVARRQLDLPRSTKFTNGRHLAAELGCGEGLGICVYRQPAAYTSRLKLRRQKLNCPSHVPLSEAPASPPTLGRLGQSPAEQNHPPRPGQGQQRRWVRHSL